MYVQDFHIIHSAHWRLDPKAMHGHTRVSESLMMLLSVSTATRPAALVEGGSAKGSNKALWWKHVLLMKVPCTKNPGQSTIVALVNLEHIKNAESSGRRLDLTASMFQRPKLTSDLGRNSSFVKRRC